MALDLSLNPAMALRLGSAGRIGLSGPWTDTLSTLYDGIDEYTDFGLDTDLAFDSADAFTISFWGKNGDSQDMFFAKDTNPATSSVGYSLHINDSGSNIQWNVKDGTFRLQAQKSFTNNDGLWHHYVCIYKGDNVTVEVWVDAVIGTQGEVGPLTGSISKPEVPFTIAEETSKHFFGGNIDEFSIWTGVASPANVATLYNGGKPNNLGQLSLDCSLIRWKRMGELVSLSIGLDAAGVVANPVNHRHHRFLSQSISGGLDKRVQTIQLFSYETEITPTDLTSNTSHSPFVTNASVNAVDAWKVGDGNNNTYISLGNPAIGEWVSWDLGVPKLVTHFRLRSWGGGRNMDPFDYEVSDDGVIWTLHQAFPDLQASQFDKTFTVRPLARNFNGPLIVLDTP